MSETTSYRLRNLLIALVATTLSIAIFFGLQTQNNSLSLEAQAQESTSLEIALSNGHPTLMEFYADWCTTCQAMAPELGEIKQAYDKKVNFVMLNVDNDKWLPEVLRYRVDGIPHFVFFDQKGKTVAQAIGEQPRAILEADLNSLITGENLPYTYSTGQVSELSNLEATPRNNSDDPRSHGSQVKLQS